MKTLVCVLLLCSSALLAQNPVPLINQLSPPSAAPSGPGFTLSVTGFGFKSDSAVYWNRSQRPTTFVSRSQLQATIGSSDVATASTATVTVVTPGPGGGASNPVYFPIRTANSTVAFGRRDIHIQNASGFTLGDFNNDGNLDIAVGNYYQAHVLILLGNGDGTFQLPRVMQSRVRPVILSAGDLNDDGNIDLVGCDHLGECEALLGDGQGNFAKTSFLKNEYTIYGFLALADFNGDGNLDVLEGGGSDYSQSAVGFFLYLGNGDGTFQNVSSVYTTQTYLNGAPAIGDFNGDGFLDVGVPALNSVGVFLGNGDGSFGPSVSYPVDITWNNVYAEGALAYDLNQDGKLDIVTNAASVLLGNGDGTFQAAGGISTGYQTSSRMGWGDFNGDGIADLAVAADESEFDTANRLKVLLGNGNATFQDPLLFPALYTPTGYPDFALAAGDFNNDGKLDVAMRDQQPIGYFHNLSLFLQGSILISPLTLTFPDQDVNTTSPPQSVILTNIGSNSKAIGTIRLDGNNPNDFLQSNNCGTSLAGGASCSIDVSFTPLHLYTRSAMLSVPVPGEGEPFITSLTGYGTLDTLRIQPIKLHIVPAALVGKENKARVYISNISSQNVTLHATRIAPPFSVVSQCPRTLDPAATCLLSVHFNPTAPGDYNGTLTFEDNLPGSPQKLPVFASATYVLLNVRQYDFGGVNVGSSSAPARIELTNTGTTTLNITTVSFGGSDPGDFSQTNTCGSQVPPGGTCRILAVFTPSQTGSRMGVLQINDDGGASPQLVRLFGVGL